MNKEQITDPYIDNLREEAIKDAIAEKPNCVEDEVEMVMRVHANFIQKRAQEFPKLCQQTYQINKQNDKFLEDYGNKGKYTDTYGWSPDGTMKHKWVIPSALKVFMENLVYKRFWEEDNAKLRDSFMYTICKGGTLFDYEQLLKVMVLKYGSNLKNALGERATGSASIQ